MKADMESDSVSIAIVLISVFRYELGVSNDMRNSIMPISSI